MSKEFIQSIRDDLSGNTPIPPEADDFFKAEFKKVPESTEGDWHRVHPCDADPKYWSYMVDFDNRLRRSLNTEEYIGSNVRAH